MKLKTGHKIALYGLPVIAAGIGLYLYLRKQRITKANTPVYTPPATPKPQYEPTPTVINTKSSYPLKSGSRGPLVKELQTILGGLTVDGIFGPKTQAALKKAYGKTQIDSATDFMAFKAKVQNPAIVAANTSKAAAIINAYKNKSDSMIFTTLETTMRVVIVTANGSYVDTDKTITFDKLAMFPHERFVPLAVSYNGELRAEYTTPFVAYTFMVLANPSALAVK